MVEQQRTRPRPATGRYDGPVADDELVLGLPRGVLMPDGAWRGVLHGDVAPYLARIEQSGSYRRRGECESDPGWKQVIPYLVVRDRGELFLMKRTRAGSDARLHERWSIGVGGHVNPEDGGVAGGIGREWTEELVADWAPEPVLVGLLNDDSDPVGAVHVGLVYRVEAKGRPVAVRETHKLEGAFVAPIDCLRVYDRMETWSSLVYDYLFERTPGIRAGSGWRGVG
jgi:predicted NUDIX family phosphoesterase